MSSKARPSFGPIAARVAVVAALVALILSVALSGPATRALDQEYAAAHA